MHTDDETKEFEFKGNGDDDYDDEFSDEGDGDKDSDDQIVEENEDDMGFDDQIQEKKEKKPVVKRTDENKLPVTIMSGLKGSGADSLLR